MNLEVLVSCMYQEDTSIIKKSNLQKVNSLIINQCDISEDKLVYIDEMHRMLNTGTRGLSVSRNIAILESIADICVISDDDEIFIDDMPEIVIKEYEKESEADIIIFNLSNRHQKLGNERKWLKRIELLRVASWQITFRRNSVKNKVMFDVKLGAGTGNGGGEENKFLFDCYDKGLKILYVPIEIAEGIEDNGSTWFFGYNDIYFYKLGGVLRYILGFSMGMAYSLYTIFSKINLYKRDISVISALYNIMKGFFKNELSREDKQ